MDLAKMMNEVGEAIAAANWAQHEPPADLAEAQAYVGTHLEWSVHLIVDGKRVDGGASNMKHGIVLHLPPDIALAAYEFAKKAMKT